MTKWNLAKSVTPAEEEKSTSLNIDAKTKLQQFIKEETRLVKGRFRHYETPGASQVVQIKKYKEVPMFKKEMVDGEMYEIPIYVARFLNGVDVTASAINGKVGTCSYPVHGFKWANNEAPPCNLGNAITSNQGGIPVPIVGVAKRVRRFGFESMEFDLAS